MALDLYDAAFAAALTKKALSGKQDALTPEQLAAANSGITAAKVRGYDDVCL